MLRAKGARRLSKPFCPVCKHTDTRRSRPRGLWERILSFMFVRFYKCRRCTTRFSQMQIVWDRRNIIILVIIMVVSAALAFGSIWVSSSPYVSIKSWVRGIIRNTYIYTPKETERDELLEDTGSSEGYTKDDLEQ